MTQPALTAEEILTWNDKTATGWRQLLADNPELLSQPCDIAGTKTVAELLQHIVAAQLRYAERLADLPITDYADIPFDSVESIYAVHDRAITILRQLIASDIDWNESIDYATRSMGSLRSDRKTILFPRWNTRSIQTMSASPMAPSSSTVRPIALGPKCIL